MEFTQQSRTEICLFEAAQQELAKALSARFEGEEDWLKLNPLEAGTLSVKTIDLTRNGPDAHLELTAQRRPNLEAEDFMQAQPFLALLSYGLPRLGKKGAIKDEHISVRPAEWHERYRISLKGPAAETFLRLMCETIGTDIDAEQLIATVSEEKRMPIPA